MIEIVAPIINFAVVLAVLWYFGRKPMAAFLSGRAEKVASAISDAESDWARAEEDLKTWSTKRREAPAEVAALRQAAESRMAALRERTLAQAQSESDRIARDAELVGQSEAAKAARALQREIVRQSVSQTESQLRRALSEDMQDRLVAEYMEILGHGSSK